MTKPTLLSALVLASHLLAAEAPPARQDLPIDIDRNGTTDFTLSMPYQGFSPEYASSLKHLLKPAPGNEVWTVDFNGLPWVSTTSGSLVPGSLPFTSWQSLPSGSVLQDVITEPGDPRFGGGFYKRGGGAALLTTEPNSAPTPNLYLAVRFGTPAGRRLGWLLVTSFKRIDYEPWTPHVTGGKLPIPPADLRLLDMGFEPDPAATEIRFGVNSTWPRNDVRLSRVVLGGDPYIQIQWAPERGWEALETAREFDAPTWSLISVSGNSLTYALKGINGREDVGPRFFRFR